MAESVMYQYRSPAGLFWIVSQESNPDCWYLGVNVDGHSRMLRWFHSAHGAALAVAAHLTGWETWDIRPRTDGEPQDLSEWVHELPKVERPDLDGHEG